ncbi:hypothetical protein [Pseudorhodobacter turbinis]|uniref:hypothetical protein n=1 Tax=Pseudorhodobacter turbinis TaxID=2500533 RepID=UPI00143D9CA6|nr:hypothetical protein [Pseudorhodobacter turbinis]
MSIPGGNEKGRPEGAASARVVVNGWRLFSSDPLPGFLLFFNPPIHCAGGVDPAPILGNKRIEIFVTAHPAIIGSGEMIEIYDSFMVEFRLTDGFDREFDGQTKPIGDGVIPPESKGLRK